MEYNDISVSTFFSWKKKSNSKRNQEPTEQKETTAELTEPHVKRTDKKCVIRDKNK